jgi:hypothetical protein
MQILTRHCCVSIVKWLLARDVEPNIPRFDETVTPCQFGYTKIDLLLAKDGIDADYHYITLAIQGHGGGVG